MTSVNQNHVLCWLSYQDIVKEAMKTLVSPTLQKDVILQLSFNESLPLDKQIKVKSDNPIWNLAV